MVEFNPFKYAPVKGLADTFKNASKNINTKAAQIAQGAIYMAEDIPRPGLGNVTKGFNQYTGIGSPIVRGPGTLGTSDFTKIYPPNPGPGQAPPIKGNGFTLNRPGAPANALVPKDYYKKVTIKGTPGTPGKILKGATALKGFGAGLGVSTLYNAASNIGEEDGANLFSEQTLNDAVPFAGLGTRYLKNTLGYSPIERRDKNALVAPAMEAAAKNKILREQRGQIGNFETGEPGSTPGLYKIQGGEVPGLSYISDNGTSFSDIDPKTGKRMMLNNRGVAVPRPDKIADPAHKRSVIENVRQSMKSSTTSPVASYEEFITDTTERIDSEYADLDPVLKRGMVSAIINYRGAIENTRLAKGKEQRTKKAAFKIKTSDNILKLMTSIGDTEIKAQGNMDLGDEERLQRANLYNAQYEALIQSVMEAKSFDPDNDDQDASSMAMLESLDEMIKSLMPSLQ